MTDLQLGYLNLKLNQEKLDREMELGQQQFEETARHNRTTEDAAREQLLVNWYDARTGRQNAESNARNAESNRMNAETNRLNYGVNAMNASTNRMNAETNRLNYYVNQYSAVSGRIQAQAAQRNADTSARRESWEHQYAAQEQSRYNQLLPYQQAESQARANQLNAQSDLAKAQRAEQTWRTKAAEQEWASDLASAKANQLRTQSALNQQQIDSGYWSQHTELEQQKSQNLTGENWGQWISNTHQILTMPANLWESYKDIIGDAIGTPADWFN